MRGTRRIHRRAATEIAPDEIFADSSNIPQFDTDHFEGRVERPITRRVTVSIGIFFMLLFAAYLAQAWRLQLQNGAHYAERADQNQLQRSILFADRGVITDRSGRPLAWNDRRDGSDFSTRRYAPYRGIAQTVGYAKMPAKDDNGVYFREESAGVDGIEAAFNQELLGKNGAQLTETSAVGKIISQSMLVPPQNGAMLALSIDAALSQGLYDALSSRARQSKFRAGAGVIMDIHSGEILALTSYPEFPLQTLADGTDAKTISALLSDKSLPFLNRAVDGLYAPGSIVKPFVAAGALTEGVIDENTQILSTGSISVPNPFDAEHPSIFNDWRAHGWVDMRHAIAVSSDVYFYEVGGGFQGQKGIGIDGLNKYLRMFGFGSPTKLQGFTEPAGIIPNVAWKEQVFPGDPWRIGDTYHTAIGQYGVTVTPLQAVRAVSAIANGGTLMQPSILASSTPQGVELPLAPHTLQVVREGMRLSVTESIAQGISVPWVTAAAKTGTAQVGVNNQWENSWIIGFFPYENPKYAFAVVLEKAPTGILVGAPAVVRDTFTWMHENAPQYLQ